MGPLILNYCFDLESLPRTLKEATLVSPKERIKIVFPISPLEQISTKVLASTPPIQRTRSALAGERK